MRHTERVHFILSIRPKVETDLVWVCGDAGGEMKRTLNERLNGDQSPEPRQEPFGVNTRPSPSSCPASFLASLVVYQSPK